MLKAAVHGTEGLEDIQPGTVVKWLTFTGWLASLMGYYYICWRKQGQTLGMKAWRLKLQQASGHLASPQQCILRVILAPLSLVCLGIGYLWCLLPNKGCLHDLLSQTEVVVLNKSSN